MDKYIVTVFDEAKEGTIIIERKGFNNVKEADKYACDMSMNYDWAELEYVEEGYTEAYMYGREVL